MQQAHEIKAKLMFHSLSLNYLFLYGKRLPCNDSAQRNADNLYITRQKESKSQLINKIHITPLFHPQHFLMAILASASIGLASCYKDSLHAYAPEYVSTSQADLDRAGTTRTPNAARIISAPAALRSR